MNNGTQGSPVAMKVVKVCLVLVVAYVAAAQLLKPPAETYEQYAARCLAPLQVGAKRDLACVIDSAKHRPAITTIEG